MSADLARADLSVAGIQVGELAAVAARPPDLPFRPGETGKHCRPGNTSPLTSVIQRPPCTGGLAMSQAKAEPFSFGTFEDFLAWEQRQEVRHELVDGVPLAMAGGTEAHDDICFNVQSTLREKLVGGPCKALSPNMPVKTGTMRGRYPDGTVDCGPRHPENRSASCPTVVFEVLSKDSRSDDFTEKLWEYNRIPSIAHYVLLEQTAPHRSRGLHPRAGGNPRDGRRD